MLRDLWIKSDFFSTTRIHAEGLQSYSRELISTVRIRTGISQDLVNQCTRPADLVRTREKLLNHELAMWRRPPITLPWTIRFENGCL